MNRFFGLVINAKFHLENRWVCALTKYLVNEIINQFKPIIITSQKDYTQEKQSLKYIVSMEPGWAAPIIKYDNRHKVRKAVFYSDPHYDTERRKHYLLKNNFDVVFSFYDKPFCFHFGNVNPVKVVHFPWAIPSRFVFDINKRNLPISNEVSIFGASNSSAYDVRNKCRKHPLVTSYDYSGVENKTFSDEGYYYWLSSKSAIIAAGSSSSEYGLLTPKYFEIAATGPLLIAQYCKDMDYTGFNSDNALVFKSEKEFDLIIRDVKSNPNKFIHKRRNAIELIRQKHTLEKRIYLVEDFLNDRL